MFQTAEFYNSNWEEEPETHSLGIACFRGCHRIKTGDFIPETEIQSKTEKLATCCVLVQ
jgi:hypothetical protein